MTTKAERSFINKEKEPTETVLLYDLSEDSEEARGLLESNEIEFRDILMLTEDDTDQVEKPFDVSELPAIVASKETFEGLERIEEFIEMVTQRPR